MLEGLLETKHGEIDEEAARKKAIVDYTIDLINKNYDAFIKAFGEKYRIEEKDSFTYLEEQLYSKTTKLINKVYGDLKESKKEIFDPRKAPYPETILGWEKTIKRNYSKLNQRLTITGKGKNVVKGYLKAQGSDEHF